MAHLPAKSRIRQLPRLRQAGLLVAAFSFARFKRSRSTRLTESESLKTLARSLQKNHVGSGFVGFVMLASHTVSEVVLRQHILGFFRIDLLTHTVSAPSEWLAVRLCFECCGFVRCRW